MITNTFKHLTIGAVAGISSALLLTCFGAEIISLWLCFAWSMVTVAYEAAQHRESLDPFYIKKKWLDTAVDLIAGNAPFFLAHWLILWR